MLSHKCKYGIRAVIFLASRSKPQSMTSGAEIARELNMPMAFTVKILQELARKGIIFSTKGPKGGFFINEELKKKPILAVINALDGLEAFHRCGIGLHTCSEKEPCQFHDTFKPNRENLLHTFENTTIGDFCVYE